MASAPAGGGARSLSQRGQDIQMMLAADVHLGTKNNCEFQMERYVYKRRTDGIYTINLGKAWEKLQLDARVTVVIENLEDIIVQSARPYGRRAVLKLFQYTDAHGIAGTTNKHQPAYPPHSRTTTPPDENKALPPSPPLRVNEHG